MADAFLGIARAPKIRELLTKQINTLFEEAHSNSPNRVVTFMSPYVQWGRFGGNTVTWWAAAAMAVPHTEEVCQSVVDALLQIASVNRLEPYVPVEIWAWLKKQPSLPPICRGRDKGTMGHVVRRVRKLGDVDILESYLLLVWSEWDYIYDNGLAEMCTSIREDLGGIGMERHREVLIKRLDHVLRQLDRGLGYFKEQDPLLDEDHIQKAREQYKELKRVLLEVDREASEILTRTPFRLTNLSNLLTPADVHRIPLDVHVCPPSPMTVMCPQLSLLVSPTSHSVYTWTPFHLSSSTVDPHCRRRSAERVSYMSSLSSLYYPVYHNSQLYTFVPEYAGLVISPFVTLLAVLVERRSDY